MHVDSDDLGEFISLNSKGSRGYNYLEADNFSLLQVPSGSDIRHIENYIRMTVCAGHSVTLECPCNNQNFLVYG